MEKILLFLLFILIFVPMILFLQSPNKELANIGWGTVLNYLSIICLFFFISISIIFVLDKPSTLKVISGIVKIVISLIASVFTIYYIIVQKLLSNVIGLGLTLAVYGGAITSVLTVISGYLDLLSLKDRNQCTGAEYNAWVILVKRFGIGTTITCLFCTFTCIPFIYGIFYIPSLESGKAYSKILDTLNIMTGIFWGLFTLLPWSLVAMNSVIKLYKIVSNDLDGCEIEDMTYIPKMKDFVMFTSVLSLACFPQLFEIIYENIPDFKNSVIFITEIIVLLGILFNVSVMRLLDKI